MFRQLGAPELVVLVLVFGFLATLGVGLYWLIRRAVAAGRRDPMS